MASLKDWMEGRAVFSATSSVTYTSLETSVLRCRTTASRPARISAQAESRAGLLECKVFYGKQSRHILGEEKDRCKVPIYVRNNVDSAWIPLLTSGIAQINEACPGVYLHYAEESKSSILIQGNTCGEDYSYTDGNIHTHSKVIIGLTCKSKARSGTHVHELLHALGAEHEHQAKGAEDFVFYDGKDEKDKDQYIPDSDYYKVARRDPFSIMMYPEGRGSHLFRHEDSDVVWKLKAPCEANVEMSEIDKVGLNQIYRPCRSATYNPVRSRVTGLWYCGRYVMQNHNRPAKNITGGYCGPNDWANCPTCRSLKNHVVEEFVSKGRWQGWSGLVYCGRYFGEREPGHDGYCGPDNGPPCPECESIVVAGAVGSFYSARRELLSIQ